MSTTDRLWNTKEVTKAIPGRWLLEPAENVNITGVSYYVKHIQPGDLVFALSQKSWGSRYPNNVDKLEEILKRGARAVVVDSIPRKIPSGLPVYLTNNTYESLIQLGEAARKRFQGKVICVTGSVGKSSTKHGLAHVLSKQGLTTESRKNFNHSPGVALSLSQTPINNDYGVYEFGVDAPKFTLSKSILAQPDVAIVTEIQSDHHRFYPTMENLVDQKALLFRGLTPDGVVVLNRDTPYYLRLRTAALTNKPSRIITFGEHRLADVKLLDFTCTQYTSHIKASVLGHTIDYQLQTPGYHNVKNSLAMLAGVCAVNANYEQAAADLAFIQAIPRRCSHSTIPYKSGTLELIDDTISANPASIKAAFDYFKLIQPSECGRKILVLGSMDQMGATTEISHASLAQAFLSSDIDLIFGIGPDVKHLCDQLPRNRIGLHTDSPEELIDQARKMINPGDVVMVKGACTESSYVLDNFAECLVRA